MNIELLIAIALSLAIIIMLYYILKELIMPISIIAIAICAVYLMIWVAKAAIKVLILTSEGIFNVTMSILSPLGITFEYKWWFVIPITIFNLIFILLYMIGIMNGNEIEFR